MVNKDERPVLGDGVFEEEPVVREVQRKQVVPYPQKRDAGNVSNSQQITTVEWCEELALSYQGNLKAIEF